MEQVSLVECYDENNINLFVLNICFPSQSQRTTILVGVKWSVATAPLKKPVTNTKTMC